MANKILILGLGNDILSDDAVGLHLVERVRERLQNDPRIDVLASCEMGLSLLDFIVGYRDVLIVDAVQTGKAPAGFLHEIEAADLKTLPEISPHFLGIGEVLALGKILGLQVPQRVIIFAIEVGDPFTVSTAMTQPVRDAIPSIVDRILAVANELAG